MDPDRDPEEGERRRLALVLGGIALVGLLWWLGQMAWSDSVDEPALSTAEGLELIGMFGGVAAVFLVAAGFAYVKGKPGAGSVAAVVLAVVAGVVGFVGGLLTAASRIDSGEH